MISLALKVEEGGGWGIKFIIGLPTKNEILKKTWNYLWRFLGKIVFFPFIMIEQNIMVEKMYTNEII